MEFISAIPVAGPFLRAAVINCPTGLLKASLVAQRLKRLPPMWETRVRSLGWEDPLEKEMATHSSTLAWRIPWTEELGRLQSTGSQSWTRLSDFTFTFTRVLQQMQINECDPEHHQRKRQKPRGHSTDTGKAFHIIQHPFIINNLPKAGMGATCLYISC